jgi:hypothetical protein
LDEAGSSGGGGGGEEEEVVTVAAAAAAAAAAVSRPNLPANPPAPSEARPRPLSAAELGEMSGFIFGPEARAVQFPDSWARQNLQLQGARAPLSFGLVQHKGGPCGILASVQALMLRQLLYPDDSAHAAPPPPLSSFSDAQLRAALGAAVVDMLWRAGDGRAALVLPARGASLRGSELLVWEATSRGALERLVAARLPTLQDPECGAAVLLVYSLLLSRGARAARGDADALAGATLIGAHGYCTQEMVNLALTGRARSHVFDGARRLDTHVLEGIDRRAAVGLLSLFEAEGYVEVGQHLKTPRAPVWVVCSESHYSVLFAADGDPRGRARFDLLYYDELAAQREEIRLSIDTSPPTPADALSAEERRGLVPPLNRCIRTKWRAARVDWNGSEPIL